MRIEIPEDLRIRLEEFAKGAGLDIQALVFEAIETRLAMEEHLARQVEGWNDNDLRTAIQEGLDDLSRGAYDDYDEKALHELFEGIKTRGRQRLASPKQRPQ